MSVRVFVDTNVLVYSRDASEPEKQPRAEAWRHALWRARCGCLSTQVLHEFYQVVTRKLVPGLPRNQARREVLDLMAWRVVSLDPMLLPVAWEAEDRFKLSFWDSLIVAAAQAGECRYLLSEDLGRQDLGGVEVIDPFAVAPDDLLGS